MQSFVGYGSLLKLLDAFNTFSIHIPLLSLRLIVSMFSVTIVTSSDDSASLKKSESSEKSEDNIEALLSAVAIAKVGQLQC